MNSGYPIAKDLVLVGGGHAHVILLRKLGMKPMPGLQITLVSPDARTPYSGMLPGVVAGHYTPDDIHIELAPLCRFAGARFIQTRMTGLDLTTRTIACSARPGIAYDVLSLDIGITPATNVIPGAVEHAIAVKPINTFLERWEHFLARARSGEVRQIGIVGAGAGGIELCLAVHRRLSDEGLPSPEFHVFTDGDSVLPGYPPAVRAVFADALAERGIRVHRQFRVGEISERSVWCATGQVVDVDATFLVTSAAAPAWLQETGLQLDDAGFIKIRETLQTPDHPEIFAVGDVASNIDHPRPKAGVFAVRQGPPLDRNVRRVLLGKQAKPFRPQREFLSLISTGGKDAVASKWGRVLTGPRVWQWKDWIDQRFMDRFNKLPEMRSERRGGLLAAFDDQMQCGGCGSKVAADLLDDVLRGLGASGAPGDMDDAARYEPPAGKIMLHSVDHFRGFIDDPFVFAKVAVNHAVSDIYAMGGKPVTALAIMTLPFATPAKTRDLLGQLLKGALEQLASDDVALVGGHTSEGMELSLGFAVNGVVDKDAAVAKAGMQVGDVLVLTKPLGTGVIFAANMQAKARGAWTEGAITSMLASNRAAAALLGDANAMTDVTGFGLAGHLSEMLRASGVGAEIILDDVPALPGAYALFGAGIQSTLQEGNERSAPVVGPGDLREKLLFDPQTSGGLLASLPAEAGQRAVECLRAAGFPEACIIGHVIRAPVLRAPGLRAR